MLLLAILQRLFSRRSTVSDSLALQLPCQSALQFDKALIVLCELLGISPGPAMVKQTTYDGVAHWHREKATLNQQSYHRTTLTASFTNRSIMNLTAAQASTLSMQLVNTALCVFVGIVTLKWCKKRYPAASKAILF